MFAVGISNTEKENVSAFKKEKNPEETFNSEIFAFVVLRMDTFTLLALSKETFKLVFIEERVNHEINVSLSFT